MKKILSWLGIASLLALGAFTCDMIGQIDLTKDKEEIKEQVLTSIESDLPADLDILADSIANEVRQYSLIPDTIHVMYGQYGEVIETFSELRGANLISSHMDTLFILPMDPGLMSDKVKIPIEDAIEIKISEMVRK